MSQATHIVGSDGEENYHILPPSHWPILSSIGIFLTFAGTVLWMHGVTVWLFWAGMVLLCYSAFSWFADIITEAQNEEHSNVVRIGLRYGFILFIISEAMFFVALFWSVFHNIFVPAGGTWPPENIVTFSPWDLPLLNTLILLTSGTTCTWAHYALLENDRNSFEKALTITCLLGLVFTLMQGFEYMHAPFSFQEEVFGSIFVMITGFHGLHVIMGTAMLFICLLRSRKGHMNANVHIGFETAAWYWHFVDIIWIMLFFVVYIAGAGNASH